MLVAAPLNAVHRTLVMNRRVRVLARHIAGTIDGPAAVLDVGCGDGTLAKAITAATPGLDIHGIDVFLRPRVAIPAIAFDGARIPYDDNSFDYVTLVDVLHHADDAENLLTEALRVARRGVVVKDHLVEGLAARSTLCLMDWVGNRGHEVQLPYNYLERAEWHQLLKRCNTYAEYWEERLGIYPFPFNLAFDRGLHFLARLAPAGIATDQLAPFPVKVSTSALQRPAVSLA